MNKNMNKRFFAEFLALLSLKVFVVFWRQTKKMEIQGDFLPIPPPASPKNKKRKKKMPGSQPELLFHDIIHVKEPLVVSLAFWHFGTVQGSSWKIPLYIVQDAFVYPNFSPPKVGF